MPWRLIAKAFGWRSATDEDGETPGLVVWHPGLGRHFTGSDAFYGYRYGLELLTCVTPLAVHSLRAVGRPARRLLPLALAYQVTFIATGSIIEGMR